MLKAKGFTIIELMLIMTMIGILVAIALPVYMNYASRAKVAEGLAAVRPGVLAIEEYYRSESAFPVDNAVAGLDVPTHYRTSVVDRLEVLADGGVRVTFRDPGLLNKTLTYTATASGTQLIWQCSSDLPGSILPRDCR